jgi:hydroxyquinol 1,2-dioxygenase
VGDLLRAGGRHAWRPAHFHFRVAAPGHVPITTEVFLAGDPYVDEDAVFGVRASLVKTLEPCNDAARAAPLAVAPPFWMLENDFVLAAA